MNPNNAKNVVVANAILPTSPTVPISANQSVPISANQSVPISANQTVSISATPTIGIAPVLFFPPEIVEALQSYVLNNFPDIGLPQDIQQVTKNFFANLPPLIPIAPNIAVPITVTPITTVIPTTTVTPTT